MGYNLRAGQVGIQEDGETMTTQDMALVAHLVRRAGFGASRDELERYASRGYEETVEDLLHPERFPEPEEDVLFRYHVEMNDQDGLRSQSRWIYRMINSQAPLREKMALFWHRVFATGAGKSMHYPSSGIQIETFRDNAFSNFRDILLDLARDPAMIFWLDNNENHRDQPNENWGRELLELFSMGVGNYTEQDVKMAARAFTGWSFTQPLPVYPFGNYNSTFVYHESDHDDGEKAFLGETGRFDGEDVVEIIVRQPATARFLCRHLYDFFVADEAPGSGVERDAAARPGRHRRDGGGVLRLRPRDQAGAEDPLQLRLLQGGPVRQGQESHRLRGGHDQAGRGRTASRSRPWAGCPAPQGSWARR